MTYFTDINGFLLTYQAISEHLEEVKVFAKMYTVRKRRGMCTINIFIGGGGGGGGQGWWMGGNSKRCLKWGGEGSLRNLNT